MQVTPGIARSASAVVSKAFYEANKDTFGKPGEKVMCSGPYKLDSWTPGKSIVTSVNPFKSVGAHSDAAYEKACDDAHRSAFERLVDRADAERKAEARDGEDAARRLLDELFTAMLGSSFAVVRHADHLAEILKEPLGTLILTLAVTGMEVMMISRIEYRPPSGTSGLGMSVV